MKLYINNERLSLISKVLRFFTIVSVALYILLPFLVIFKVINDEAGLLGLSIFIVIPHLALLGYVSDLTQRKLAKRLGDENKGRHTVSVIRRRVDYLLGFALIIFLLIILYTKS